MKKLVVSCWLLVVGVATAAFGENAAFARATGASMRLDTRQGVRIAAKGESETIAYSPRWGSDGGHGVTALPACTVTVDGATLKTASEEGGVEWSPTSTGAHTLTHTAGDVTYTAQFTVLGEDVQVHGGVLQPVEEIVKVTTNGMTFVVTNYNYNVIWSADKVHVINSPLTVPDYMTLTIEPGAVVKFMTGTSLTVNGTCVAYGVIFTHVNDDTAGGDTLMDGDATKPVMDAYKLTGNIYEDDATERRYETSQTLTSSISGTVRLKGHKVYLANSSITVNSGATLTLLPGAIVKFASGCSMTVNGTLDAQGTRAAPIVFTSQKDDDWGGDSNGDGETTYAQAGDWHQISGSGTVKMNYCQVLWCSAVNNQGALYPRGGTWTFDNSIVAHCQFDCMRGAGGNFTADNSVFMDSSMGAAPQSGTCRFVNCVFYYLTTAVRWGAGSFYNCIFADIAEDIIDTKFYSSTVNSPFGHCCFWAPNATGDKAAAKVGKNGNIWGEPKFVDPGNGDFRIAADSPCVDAGDGTVAPELDYWDQPRMDAKGKKATGIPNADGICPDIGIYEFPGKVAAPVADLAVLSVTAPATAVPGEEIAVSYVVTNRGGEKAVGVVRDRIVLKGAEVALGGQTVAAGEAQQLYSLAAGAAATFTARVKCPTVKSGNWTIGVTVNAERDVFEQVTANNTGWASEPTAVELEALAAGERRVTVGAGSASGFVVAAGVRTLRVASDAALDKVAVYGANGAVPASAEGGVAAVRLGDGSWLLVLPEAKADEKGYVVIENGGATVVELKVTAEEEKLAVYGVAPGRVAAVDGVSVTITGTGLGGATAVTLGGRTATRVVKVNDAQIAATFDLKGMATGTADIAVDGGGAGRAALPVEVYKTTQGPKLEAKLELPSSVRDGRIYTAWIEYANVGDEPMTAPIFTVKRADSATKLKILMSDDFTTGPLHIVGIGSGYPAGVLAVGDSGRIPFYFMPSGSYRLELSHAKEETAATEYRQFADTADYRQAVADTATRLSARGKAEYRVRECVNFVLAERANRDVAAISGTVLDATTRNPLAGVTVSAVMTNDTTRTASCTADADGHFSLTMLADGDWQLSVDGGVVTGGDVVTITNQKDVNGQMLTAHLLATVSGTVLTADTHEPIEGAAVRLYLNGGDLPSDETETDAGGAFRIGGIVSGTYALVVNSKDGYVGDVVTNVVLSLGGSYAAGVFELSKGAVLYGTVTQDGAIVTNGTVYACFEDGSAARAACSANGTYCFDGLPPYGYRVRYAGDGVQADFVDVTLGAGETKELDLVAKATPLFFPIRPRGYGTLTTQFMVADPVLATNATAFAWDFDNDGVVDSTAEEPEWTYNTVGSYSVKLVATTPQGAKTSLYENCVTVEEAIENILNANAFRVDESAGIDCTALGENTLTLVGTPPLTLAAGVVVGGKFGDEWYIRRIKGVSKNGTTYTLTTEEATLDDLYASYCFTACEPTKVSQPVKKLLKSSPARLLGASGDDRIVKVYAEGGVTLSPSVGWSGAYILYDWAKPLNGTPYYRVGVAGKLYFSLSGEVSAQGGVKLNPEFSFPILIPTTVPFVDAKGELVFGTSLGVEGKVSGGFEVWANPRISMGIERFGDGPWQMLKPFDLSDKGSETKWLEVSGSVKGEAYVKVKAGLVAGRLLEVTIGPKVALTESLTATVDGPTTWEASLGLSGVIEAGVKTENVPLVGKFLSFLDVGASFDVGVINVRLQKIESPEPDFTVFPNQGDAPLDVSLQDASKEESYYHIGLGDFKRRPKSYELDLGDGNRRTYEDRFDGFAYRYENDGEYTVSLKVKGWTLSSNQQAKRKVYVGKEKPPEDEQQKDDGGGGTPAKSCDPNEMAGPFGAGDPETERFVKPGEWMDYTIYFENKADADVPAQEVFVDAQLSEYLDWSTFEMGEVAFNNQNETVLAGLKNGMKTVAQNGADYKVQLSVTFDEKTGAAHWYLRSYDPGQSDYNYWPAAVDAGFLPPNDETHRGEGHITYRVKVREDAPTGVRIDAAATIVFDQNDPIQTDPSWWNTVGKMHVVRIVVDGVEQTVETFEGMPYGELPTPSVIPTGYAFCGWYTGANGSGTKVEPTTPVSSEVTQLHPYWKPNAFRVHFEPNGEDITGEMDDQAFTYGTTQALATCSFVCDRMTFVGWATNETGAAVYADGEVVSNLTAVADGAVTLYAVWTEIPVSVLYDDAAKFIDVEGGEIAPYEKAATVYDGYLADADGVVKGTVQVKVAKGKTDKKTGAFSSKVTATVQLADGSKKISFKNGLADAAGNVTEMEDKNGNRLAVSLGVNGLGGTFRLAGGGASYKDDGARNLFSAKDNETKAIAAAIEDAWVGAINVVGDGVVLTVSIAKKGKVKVSGTVDGTKVTATSQLLVGAKACCVPVVITKKASLAFNLWLAGDGVVEIAGLDGATAGKAGALKSSAAFRMDGAVLEKALPGLYGIYLPDGLSVVQSGTKWVVAPDEKGKAAKAGQVAINKKTGEIDETKLGVNPSALKLTYKQKDGSFKGSFKAYTLDAKGKIKSYTINVTGVMVGDVGYGTATLKKPAASFPITVE